MLAVALALLAAAAAWGGAWLRGALTGRERTAVCAADVMEDAVPLSGVVLRQERALVSPAAMCRLLLREGERVPAGGAAAILYDESETLFRASLLLRLRGSLQREETPPDAAPGELRRRLSDAAARQDPAAAAGQSLRLALMGAAAGDRAALLRAEIAALEAAGADRAVFAAPASGFFSALTDGWESLSFPEAEAMAPEELARRLAAAPEGAAPAWGRLVTGSEWRFLALTDAAAAARFAPGDTAELRLPSGSCCAARVLSLREGAGGRVRITFSVSDHLAEALNLRAAELTAVLERWEGLRLPAEAVRTGDGESYVLRAAGALSARAGVTVLARQGGDVLVGSDALRPGTEVLLP